MTNKHKFMYAVGGLAFYEDAKHGDEEALLVKINGEFISTSFFDRPSTEDADDLAKLINERITK